MPDSDITQAPPKMPARRPHRLRLIGAATVIPCWAVLAVGMSLTARAKGDGTHTQLGLSPCRTMVVNGTPCPSCGLTTSITAAAHGNFADAARANVFGVVLFFALAIAGAFGALQAVTGRDVLGRIFRRRWWLFCGILIAGLLTGWAIKLAVGYNTGQYPTH